MPYVVSAPFGSLPVLPVALQTKPVVFKSGCYICEDPDYARYGLPLCQKCPLCGGHVPADSTVCDECSWDLSQPLE